MICNWQLPSDRLPRNYSAQKLKYCHKLLWQFYVASFVGGRTRKLFQLRTHTFAKLVTKIRAWFEILSSANVLQNLLDFRFTNDVKMTEFVWPIRGRNTNFVWNLELLSENLLLLSGSHEKSHLSVGKSHDARNYILRFLNVIYLSSEHLRILTQLLSQHDS
jgi:hypothetical protein